MTVAPFRPVPGLDYPRNFYDFLDWFSDEQRCYAFIERIPHAYKRVRAA